MLASLRRAPRLLARAGASPAVAATAVRAFAAAAGGKKSGDSGSLSHADITKAFLDMDAAAGPAAGLDIPVKLTGRSGELTAELYAKTSKAKTFDKAVKELEVNSMGATLEPAAFLRLLAPIAFETAGSSFCCALASMLLSVSCLRFSSIAIHAGFRCGHPGRWHGG